MVCWFHHSLGSGPWCYPFAMAIVLEVCTLSCTLVMYRPKQGHACIADQNWYCPGCVAGAGRSENIRVKSKDVKCWVVLSVAVAVWCWRMLRHALGWTILRAVVPPNVVWYGSYVLRVQWWYGMVDVCDGYLAAEASGSSFG